MHPDEPSVPADHRSPVRSPTPALMDEAGKPKKNLTIKLEGGGPNDDSELMKEMWDAIANQDSEDDQEGARNKVAQTKRGKRNYKIDRISKPNKKRKKKNEKSPEEIAFIVENAMAELEVTAEEDAELNRQSKPAVNKLKKLPFLVEILSNRTLQQQFLDHGILAMLRLWLEPLPDGSLPNWNVRSAILKILNEQLPLDVGQSDRIEQLKKSGLGKVIMFLSKTEEETTANRKLANQIVEKWSRIIFNISSRFEDLRGYRAQERIALLKRPPPPPNKISSRMLELPRATGGFESRDVDVIDFEPRSRMKQQEGQKHASRPEALALDFMVRPQSKIDPLVVRRAQAKQQDECRVQMIKKKQMQLQAYKESAQGGRGMITYL